MNYQRPAKLNKKQIKARKEFAAQLGVKFEELDDLFRVTVEEDGSECDVNVQACLEKLDKENELLPCPQCGCNIEVDGKCANCGKEFII